MAASTADVVQSEPARLTRTFDNDDDDDDEELLRGEHWITIQRNTFANWVVERLGARRCSELGLVDSSVDLQRDLCDGRVLCALMEALQKRQRRRLAFHPTAQRPAYQHQCIDNINLALREMADDGIRLVNIGRFNMSHALVRI